MERETIKVISPIGKHEVILNAWITGRARREIQRPFMTAMNVSVKEGEPEIESKNSAVLEEVENKTIELTVVSVNGKTDDVLNSVLNMRNQDFNFILKKIDEITSEKNFTKPE
jgi:hypothetical protein